MCHHGRKMLFLMSLNALLASLSCFPSGYPIILFLSLLSAALSLLSVGSAALVAGGGGPPPLLEHPELVQESPS